PSHHGSSRICQRRNDESTRNPQYGTHRGYTSREFQHRSAGPEQRIWRNLQASKPNSTRFKYSAACRTGHAACRANMVLMCNLGATPTNVLPVFSGKVRRRLPPEESTIKNPASTSRNTTSVSRIPPDTYVVMLPYQQEQGGGNQLEQQGIVQQERADQNTRIQGAHDMSSKYCLRRTTGTYSFQQNNASRAGTTYLATMVLPGSVREGTTSLPGTPSMVPTEGIPAGNFSTGVQVQSSVSGGTFRHPSPTPPDSNTLQVQTTTKPYAPPLTFFSGKVRRRLPPEASTIKNPASTSRNTTSVSRIPPDTYVVMLPYQQEQGGGNQLEQQGAQQAHARSSRGQEHILVPAEQEQRVPAE
ncbi:hypothetical protein KSS87_008389, partial [Heliosperma pusillum]